MYKVETVKSMAEFISWVSLQTPTWEIEPRRPWAGFTAAERREIINELAHHQDAMS
jgi:hypothetical protein